MNDAVIEQHGPAREVWSAPKTEFVARFMGAHNVITFEGNKVALRADDVCFGLEGLPATITSIEYQGAYFAVHTRTDAGDEILALMPDEAFLEKPKNPGDAVSLTWNEGRLHRLHA